jgi:hypothetical protein
MRQLYNENKKVLKKLKKTLEDGTSHVHGLAELIL